MTVLFTVAAVLPSAFGAYSESLDSTCHLIALFSEDETVESECNDVGYCVFDATATTANDTCTFDTSIECAGGDSLTYKAALEELIQCGPTTDSCNGCKDEVTTFLAAMFNMMGFEEFTQDEVNEMSDFMETEEGKDVAAQLVLCSEEAGAEYFSVMVDSLSYIGVCDIDEGDVDDKLQDIRNSASSLAVNGAIGIAVATLSIFLL